MSQLGVEIFLGRIITDARFNVKALRSLESACENEGINLSPQEMAYLKKINFDEFNRVAVAIDDAIKRG